MIGGKNKKTHIQSLENYSILKSLRTVQCTFQLDRIAIRLISGPSIPFGDFANVYRGYRFAIFALPFQCIAEN